MKSIALLFMLVSFWKIMQRLMSSRTDSFRYFRKNNSWRAYFVRSPSSRSHVLHDNDGDYICWDTPLQSKKAAQRIALLWKESYGQNVNKKFPMFWLIVGVLALFMYIQPNSIDYAKVSHSEEAPQFSESHASLNTTEASGNNTNASNIEHRERPSETAEGSGKLTGQWVQSPVQDAPAPAEVNVEKPENTTAVTNEVSSQNYSQAPRSLSPDNLRPRENLVNEHSAPETLADNQSGQQLRRSNQERPAPTVVDIEQPKSTSTVNNEEHFQNIAEDPNSSNPDNLPIKESLGNSSLNNENQKIQQTSPDMSNVQRIRLVDKLDYWDKRALNNCFEKIPSRELSGWQNRNTGNAYQITIQDTWFIGNNKPCRKAILQLNNKTGGGETEILVACRNIQGGWEHQASW